MKKFKFQKENGKIKDSDFLDGYFDSWSIYIKSDEFSLPKRYMGIGFETEQSANREMERIKVQYPKLGKPLYHIEVKKEKVRRLKSPIPLT